MEDNNIQDSCCNSKYASIRQMDKLDEMLGRRFPFYPRTVIQAVHDGRTGASLEAILAQYNNIYVQYQGTAGRTRNIVPKEMRRKGIIISYVDMQGNAITEKCVNDAQRDNFHWGLDVNWVRVDELTLSGDISVSVKGTWVINGEDTGIAALGPKGNNGLTPWLKTIDNKLHFSYDNETWEVCSDYIAAYFRFQDNKFQISRDNKTWSDLSGEVTNSLSIKAYVTDKSQYPNPKQGDMIMVGPTYADDDAEHTKPIYHLNIYNAGGWVDHGPFQSINAGVVQELGDSENTVMSQKCVLSILCTLANGINGNIYNTVGTINPTNGTIQSSSAGNYVTGFLLLHTNQVLVIGYASEATACLAFYDEDYSFISSVYGGENSGKLLLVDVPENAVYCRACGQENKRFVYTKTTEKFQQIFNSITFLNVSEKYPLEDPSTDFYTLQTAREKVPLAERKRGHIISFQSGYQKWEYWLWFGQTDRNDTETGWNNDDLWYKISVDIAITNVTKEFPLSDGYYTLQTARVSIPISRRRSGHIIMFQPSSQKYELWQWVGNSDRNDTETGWNSDTLWKRIPYFDEFDKVLLYNKILEEDTLDLSKEIVLTDAGYINYQTGSIGTDSSISSYTKDYIECYEADYIIQSMSTGNSANSVGIAFYDKDKDYISGENRPVVSGNNIRKIKKIKIPDNAYYFRTSYYDLSHRIQLGEFTCLIVRNKYPDKNAYKKEYLTQDEICDFFAIDGTTGEKVSSSTLGCTRYVDVLSEKVLYLPVLQITNDNLGYAFYDIDKNYISGGSQIGDNDFTYKKVAVPKDAVYIRFSSRTYAWMKTNNYLDKDEINVPCGYLPNGKRPYQDGLIFFSVKVNQKINKYWDASVVDNTDDDYEYTTGVLILPKNYTQTGKPVPLIMYCHGYSHGVWYDHWGDTDTFLQQKEYWASKGYAVFDCNGARNNNKTVHFVSAGCNQFVEGYRKCYEYIVRHYNVDKNIFVIGGSAGGPTAINYAYTWAKEVRALALFSTWTNIKTDAWGQGQRSPFAEYMGFNNTDVYEDDKTIGYDPALRILEVNGKDLMYIPVPVKAWIGALETESVFYSGLFKFINAARNAGCSAYMCEKYGLGHEIVSGHILCIDNEVLDWFDVH